MGQQETWRLPDAFVARMKDMLGDECDAFLASYEKERALGLRVNTLKVPAAEFAEKNQAAFSLRPVSWCREGLYYAQESRPGRHPYHEAGAYYIQEPSAMAVVSLLEPKPGEKVLDLCAAPGGKTTHIASRLEGCGLLVSNEIHPARAKILSQNVERMGIGNAIVTNEDSGSLARFFPDFFDCIVVDAPCSGEGMFRKDEQARNEWSEANVKLCAERQQEILDNAAEMLKPGGRMVYSTCTFAPVDEAYLESFEIVKEIVSGVRTIRLQKNIPNKEELALQVLGGHNDAFNPVIAKMCNLSEITKTDDKAAGAVSFLVRTTEYAVPLGNMINVEEELAKLEEELKYQQGFLNSVLKKLSNESFVSKAPAKVIDMERKKQADAESKIKSIEESIAALKK